MDGKHSSELRLWKITQSIGCFVAVWHQSVCMWTVGGPPRMATLGVFSCSCWLQKAGQQREDQLIIGAREKAKSNRDAPVRRHVTALEANTTKEKDTNFCILLFVESVSLICVIITIAISEMQANNSKPSNKLTTKKWKRRVLKEYVCTWMLLEQWKKY